MPRVSRRMIGDPLVSLVVMRMYLLCDGCIGYVLGRRKLVCVRAMEGTLRRIVGPGRTCGNYNQVLR